MKKILLIIVVPTLLAVSCKKDLEDKVSPVAQTDNSVTEFKKLKVTSEFNWKTGKEVRIHVTGFETESPVQNTMKISSEDGKTIFLTQKVKMNENTTLNLQLPASVSKFKITYGSLVQTYLASEKEVSFDFLSILSTN